MWPQEIVVGDEECGQGDGPIPRAKTIGDVDVMFVSAIETFDELFITPIFFGFAVEVLQANHLVVGKGLAARLRLALRIEKVEPIGVSRITIGDKTQCLLGAGGSSGFFHRDRRRQRAARIGDVISDDLSPCFREKKEHVGMLTANFDVGFIASQMRIQRAFVREIEAMTVKSRGFRVIEHGLMREGNTKELPEHQRGFARPDRKGNIEGENKADPMRRVMNAQQVDARR